MELKQEPHMEMSTKQALIVFVGLFEELIVTQKDDTKEEMAALRVIKNLIQILEKEQDINKRLDELGQRIGEIENE